MRLLLTVLGAQRSQLGDRALHQFDANGGTLGRSASCDWTLPDGGNTLSARHAAISHNGHGFVITDTSTNGVYLNGVDAPLGRGQSAPLASGDSIYISDYVISVTILNEAAQPAPAPASPLYVPPPAPIAAFPGVAPAPAPFALPGQAPAAQPRSADRFAGLSMDDLLGPPPAPQPAAFQPPAPPAPQPQTAFAPPPVQPPPAQPAAPRPAQAIPDDFDFSDLMPGGIPAAPRPAPAAMAQPAAWPAPPPPTAPIPVAMPMPPAMPGPPPVAAPAIPDGYAMPGAPPAPAAAPPAGALDPLAMLRQRAVARAASIDLSPGLAGAADPAPSPPRPAIGAMALPGGPAGSAGGDDAAFWQALGLDPAAIPAAQRQDMLAELGRAMRETAGGLVAILSARKSMKDEFRIEQTRLAAHENNPFKFFRSGDEALRRIVAEAKPGYLPLDKAVRQGFSDIQAHEVATVVAMQSALRKLLATMAPAAIEAGAERGLLGGRPDKAKMWDRFVETHARLAGDLDSTTRDMLAEELSRAYAEQANSGEGGR